MATPLLALSTGSHCFDVQFHPSEPVLVTATIEGDVEFHKYWEREVVAEEKAEAELDSDYDVKDDEEAVDGGEMKGVTDGTGAVGSGDDNGEAAAEAPAAGAGVRDDGAYGSECLNNLKCHKDSCRTARFMPFGKGKKSRATRLVTASADSTAAVWDIVTQKKLTTHPLGAGGNCVLPIDAYLFAVGDDEGGISIFDLRQGSDKPTRKYEENEDFITDMIMGKDDNSLCATSGDGTLAVYDVRRKPKLIAMSDFQEDEFLSLTLMKEGKKVVCGSQKGVLCIFSWGDFGDQKDRIPGHPMSVDALASLSEDVLLTGASDGTVRIVTAYHAVHGNRIVAEVAQHGSYPIERIALSSDAAFFATASHGQPAVKLWRTEDALKILNEADVSQLADVQATAGAKDDADADSDLESEEPPTKRARKAKKKAAAKGQPKKMATTQQLFFSNLS